MAVVWIAGWPHCGSTLMRTFLRDTFDMRCVSTYPEPGLAFAFPDSDAWAAKYAKDRDAALAELDEAEEWVGVKTHEFPQDDRPAIYVARDGRDAIGSLSRFWDLPASSLLGDVAVRRDTFICDVIQHRQLMAFGTWSSNYLAWDILRRPNGHLLRFGDILAEPDKVRGVLAAFMGIEPTGRWVDRFEEYQAKWPKMYDDKDDEHRHSMDPEVEAMFWRLHGPVMKHLGFGEGE